MSSLLEVGPADLTPLERLREEEVKVLRQYLRSARELLTSTANGKAEPEKIKQWLAAITL